MWSEGKAAARDFFESHPLVTGYDFHSIDVDDVNNALGYDTLRGAASFTVSSPKKLVALKDSIAERFESILTLSTISSLVCFIRGPTQTLGLQTVKTMINAITAQCQASSHRIYGWHLVDDAKDIRVSIVAMEGAQSEIREGEAALYILGDRSLP